MKNVWLKLRDLLQEERKAIVSGKVGVLLACLEEKERLLQDPRLKDESLPPEVREEIRWLVKHNEMLLKAGLSFIEEAYQFLARQMAPKVGYQRSGKAKACQVAQIVDGVA